MSRKILSLAGHWLPPSGRSETALSRTDGGTVPMEDVRAVATEAALATAADASPAALISLWAHAGHINRDRPRRGL